MKNNWEIKKLGDIFDVQSSKRVHKADWKAEGIPFYRAREVVKLAKNGFVDNELFISEELFKEFTKDKGAPKKDDIIISAVGTLGECYLVRENDKFYIKDASVLWFSKISDVYSRYIEFAFKSIIVQEQVMDKSMGATVGTLTISRAKNIRIPLPPPPEQKRIVKILDEVFTAIEKAKANAEKNLQNSRELFDSYLNKVFANPGEDWEERKLGEPELLEIVDGDRGTNYPKKSDFLESGHCLFMNTKNVRPDGFNFTSNVFITKEKDDILRNGKLNRNDVVMTTRGTIGNIGLYHKEVPYENIRINSGMLIFRPNSTKILPEYLFEVYRSGIMKNQILKYVSGAAQPQLPIKTLVNFSIPVPKSLMKQKELVSTIRKLNNETNSLTTIYKKKVLDLDELKRSILQKAFDGML